MKKILCTLCIVFFSYLIADEERVIVKLETEDRPLPVYLAHCDNVSPFSAEYIGKLEKIFRFDLNHSSRTKTIQNAPDLEAASQGQEIIKGENIPTWNALNIVCVAKPMIDKEGKLSAKVLLVHKKSIKTIEGILLTGDLNHDRKQIHRLSDTIHKNLFDTQGIATTRMIYTVTKRISPEKEIGEVWMSDYDGGNPHQITHENVLCINPIFFPPKPNHACGSIFFVSYISGVSKIHSANIQNGTSHRAIKLQGNQLMPSITFQRDKIAFISDAAGNPDLFIAPVDPETGEVGKPRQIFSMKHCPTQGTPTFSPDGNQIAFVSNKDGLPRIYLMNIPDPGEKLGQIKPILISKRNISATAPQWSPDGKKIAYQALIGKHRQICLFDITTKEEKELTTGAHHKENPAWAPDSQHLVYNSEGQLYLLSLLDPKPVVITSGTGEKRFPAWEPKAVQ